jgi:hypothetical protein
MELPMPLHDQWLWDVHFHTQNAFSQDFLLDDNSWNQETEWQLTGPVWTNSVPWMLVFNHITPFTSALM